MANHFFKSKSLFSTTLSSSISTGTGETITLASVTGLPTDTEVTLTFERVDAVGVKTPTKMERIRGTISGSTLVSYTRAVGSEGTEQAHLAGSVIECVWNGKDWNDAVDGFLVEHNQDGTHSKSVLSKVISGTRNLTAASGDVSYTGTGFVPTTIEAVGMVDGVATLSWGVVDSAGVDDGFYTTTVGLFTKSGVLLFIRTGSGAYQTGVLKSYDTNGFTITWEKTGSPTGTANLIFKCLR